MWENMGLKVLKVLGVPGVLEILEVLGALGAPGVLEIVVLGVGFWVLGGFLISDF